MAKRSVPLAELCFARSGDKGDVCSVGLLAVTPRAYRAVVGSVRADAIRKHFGDMVKGEVELYPMPNIDCLHVVLRRALGGGATRTLRYDQTGKAMGNALLRMEVEVDEAIVSEARAATEEIFAKYGRAWK